MMPQVMVQHTRDLTDKKINYYSVTGLKVNESFILISVEFCALGHELLILKNSATVP